MVLLSKVSLLTLGVALAVGAQSQLKQFAGADEFNLATQIFAEENPDRQIALLEEWIARYPKTDFERERLISFALAFQRLGKLSKSLTRVREALKLDPNDPRTLLFIAALGPTLPAASDNQIATVTACATKLVSARLVLTPPVAATSAEPTAGPASLADPETQRVLAFIRQLKASTVRMDPEVVRRQVAEAGLEWAKNLKR